MNDKISIVVPVYNVEEYLIECIDSLINQTYKNIEIILVDDGSTDNSPYICDKYAKLDNRVKVIHKKNGGVSLARTTGINKAKGKYLCFVDSDDAVSNDYVLKMYKKIVNYNVSYVIYGNSTDKEIISKINKKKYKGKIINTSTREFANLIFNEKINSPWSKMYNLEFIKKRKLEFNTNISIAEDLLFNMNYVQDIDKIYYSNEPIYWYRKGINDSLSNKYNPNKFDNLMYVNKKLNILCENNKYCIDALNAIKVKNIFSCYKDEIKKNKLDIDNFIKYAQREYRGKINVKIRFLLLFLEAFFYNNKMFKTIYKIINKT